MDWRAEEGTEATEDFEVLEGGVRVTFAVHVPDDLLGGADLRDANVLLSFSHSALLGDTKLQFRRQTELSSKCRLGLFTVEKCLPFGKVTAPLIYEYIIETPNGWKSEFRRGHHDKDGRYYGAADNRFLRTLILSENEKGDGRAERLDGYLDLRKHKAPAASDLPRHPNPNKHFSDNDHYQRLLFYKSQVFRLLLPQAVRGEEEVGFAHPLHGRLMSPPEAGRYLQHLVASFSGEFFVRHKHPSKSFFVDLVTGCVGGMDEELGVLFAKDRVAASGWAMALLQALVSAHHDTSAKSPFTMKKGKLKHTNIFARSSLIVKLLRRMGLKEEDDGAPAAELEQMQSELERFSRPRGVIDAAVGIGASVRDSSLGRSLFWLLPVYHRLRAADGPQRGMGGTLRSLVTTYVPFGDMLASGLDKGKTADPDLPGGFSATEEWSPEIDRMSETGNWSPELETRMRALEDLDESFCFSALKLLNMDVEEVLKSGLYKASPLGCLRWLSRHLSDKDTARRASLGHVLPFLANIRVNLAEEPPARLTEPLLQDVATSVQRLSNFTASITPGSPQGKWRSLLVLETLSVHAQCEWSLGGYWQHCVPAATGALRRLLASAKQLELRPQEIKQLLDVNDRKLQPELNECQIAALKQMQQGLHNLKPKELVSLLVTLSNVRKLAGGQTADLRNSAISALRLRLLPDIAQAEVDPALRPAPRAPSQTPAVFQLLRKLPGEDLGQLLVKDLREATARRIEEIPHSAMAIQLAEHLDSTNKALIHQAKERLSGELDKLKGNAVTCERAEQMLEAQLVYKQLIKSQGQTYGAQLFKAVGTLVEALELARQVAQLKAALAKKTSVEIVELEELKGIASGRAALSEVGVLSRRVEDGTELWRAKPRDFGIGGGQVKSLQRFADNVVVQHHWQAGLKASGAGEGGQRRLRFRQALPSFHQAETKSRSECEAVLDGSATPDHVVSLFGGWDLWSDSPSLRDSFVPTFQDLSPHPKRAVGVLERRKRAIEDAEACRLQLEQLQTLSRVAVEAGFRSVQKSLQQEIDEFTPKLADKALLDLSEGYTKRPRSREFWSREAMTTVTSSLGALQAASPLLEWTRKTLEPEAGGGKLRLEELEKFEDWADPGEAGDADEVRAFLRRFVRLMSAFGPLIFDLPADPDWAQLRPAFGRLPAALEKQYRSSCTQQRLPGCATDGAILRPLWDDVASLLGTGSDHPHHTQQSSQQAEPNSAQILKDRLNKLWYSRVASEKDTLQQLHSIILPESDAEKGGAIVPYPQIVVQPPPSAEQSTNLEFSVTLYRDAESAPISLKAMQDLRSGLAAMLVNDLGTQKSITQYSSLVEYTKRLVALLKQHWEAGNLFLSSAHIIFYLDPKSGASAEVALDRDRGVCFQGSGPVQTQMKKLCVLLESLTEEWREFVKKERAEQPLLFHFRDRQLLALRSELAAFRGRGEEAGLGRRLESLLQAVVKAPDAQRLRRAMDAAAEKSRDDHLQQRQDLPIADGRFQELCSHWVNSGKNLDLVKKAVSQLGPDADHAAYAQWFEDHQDDDDSDDDHQDDFTEGGPSSKKPLSEESKDLVAQVSHHLRGTTNIQFPGANESHQYARGNREALGIPEVGRILSLLRESCEEARGEVEKLELPSWVAEGRPSLAAVPQVDVLRHAVSLYQAECGTRGTRLRFDNVLVCSEETVAEDLELLLKRIEHAERPDLYAVLFVEELSLELGQRLEPKLRDLRSRQTFGLVLFCSKEGFLGSHLAGLLADLKGPDVPHDWALSSPQCRRFMHNQMQRQSASGSEHQSSFHDPNDKEGLISFFALSAPKKFKATLVTSCGYGQGKSLYVSRVTAGDRFVKIPVHSRRLSPTAVIRSLVKKLRGADGDSSPLLIHVDVSSHLTQGVDAFIFQLHLLGGLTAADGEVWRLRPSEHVMYEMTAEPNPVLRLAKDQNEAEGMAEAVADDFRFSLPIVQCHSPTVTMELLGRRLFANPFSFHRFLDLETLVEGKLVGGEVKEGLLLLCARYAEELDGGRLRQRLAKGEAVTDAWLADQVHRLLLLCGRGEDGAGETAPSWLEFINFLSYLASHIRALETKKDLALNPGFRMLLLRLSLESARKFATRTLQISEEVSRLETAERRRVAGLLEHYQPKKAWPASPALFLNADGKTLSFFNAVFQRTSMFWNDAVDRSVVSCVGTDGAVVAEDIEAVALRESTLSPKDKVLPAFAWLSGSPKASEVSNWSTLSRDFDTYTRDEKLRQLYLVIRPGAKAFLDRCGDHPPDPDPKYELTKDNVLKLLAIHQRLLLDIPVVMMGETGCGKTYLLQFYSRLTMAAEGKKIPASAAKLRIFRVHGGTDAARIRAEVWQAAEESRRDGDSAEGPTTILFLDEANTSAEQNLIKEVVLERTVEGEPLRAPRLRFALALNPYRRLSPEAVAERESAALGCFVRTAAQRFGDGEVPLRHLVYRVHPLCPSLLPLAWDFGTLSDSDERLYIKLMVARFCKAHALSMPLMNSDACEALVKLLCAAHQWMRAQDRPSKDSQRTTGHSASLRHFLSLRDADRMLETFRWFHANDSKIFGSLAPTATGTEQATYRALLDVSQEGRAAALAFAVCYRASLPNPEKFDKELAGADPGGPWFTGALSLGDIESPLQKLVDRATRVMVDECRVEPDIAPNAALRENVFMMVVCAQLRIPLFVIGKPGSSKSLAKSILARSLSGESSKVPGGLFQALEKVRFVPFQCSQLSTAEGIEETFRAAERISQRYRPRGLSAGLAPEGVAPGAESPGSGSGVVGVVVLDEIGQAEESPNLPLKALHALFDGGLSLSAPERIGCIGISNWALDPAKMNRAIAITRQEPSKDELRLTAEHICGSKRGGAAQRAHDAVKHLIQPLTEAYRKLQAAQSQDYEFFGLRDFNDMMRRLAAAGSRVEGGDRLPDALAAEVAHRSFGGFKALYPDAWTSFLQQAKLNLCEASSSIDLIKKSLTATNRVYQAGAEIAEPANRYLLVLSEDDYAVRKIRDLEEMRGSAAGEGPEAGAARGPEVVFGSPFPGESTDAQVLRHMNRIRACMMQGRGVVMRDLGELYPSFYELLNQAFERSGRDSVVQMGLGAGERRVVVHERFRLVVVADEAELRRSFPAALVNRLEKHVLFLRSTLSQAQLHSASRLTDWAHSVARPLQASLDKYTDWLQPHHFSGDQAFVGLSDTTAQVLVDSLPQPLQDESDQDMKRRLLQTVTPETLLRIGDTKEDADWVLQNSSLTAKQSLCRLISHHISKDPSGKTMLQVTTGDRRLLSQVTLESLLGSLTPPVAGETRPGPDVCRVFQMDSFRTEEEQRRAAAELLLEPARRRFLVIQCSGARSEDRRISATRYLLEELKRSLAPSDAPLHVVLVLTLQRTTDSLLQRVERWRRQGGKDVLTLSVTQPLKPNEQEELAQAAGFSPSQLSFNFFKIESQLATVVPELLRAANCGQLSVFQLLPSAAAEQRIVRLVSDIKRVQMTADSVAPKVLLLLVRPTLPAFPSAEWDSWHLETLLADKIAMPTLDRLRHLSPSAVLGSGDFGAKEFLRELLPIAAAQVRSNDPVWPTRVSLMMGLLADEEFVEALRGRLRASLEATEEAGEAGEWACSVGRSGRALAADHSLHRCLLLCLKDRMKAPLAEILAALDSAANLDSFCSQEHGWRRQLWLSLLSSLPLLEPNSLPGPGSGALFPFSWLLDRLVEDLARRQKRAAGGEPLTFAQLQAKVLEAEWGQVLERLVASHRSEAAQLYAQDILRCRFPSSVSDKEVRLLTGSINRAAAAIHEQDEHPGVVKIHLAFEELEEELERAHLMMASYAELLERLPDDWFRAEEGVDVGMARAIVRRLSAAFVTDASEPWMGAAGSISYLAIVVGQADPSKDRVNQWLGEVQKAKRSGITAVLQDLGDEEELKRQWAALEMCSLFYVHTEPIRDLQYFSAKPIFDGLVTSAQSPLQFLQTLRDVLGRDWRSQLINVLARGWSRVKCLQCKTAFESGEAVVALECGHLMHGACMAPKGREPRCRHSDCLLKEFDPEWRAKSAAAVAKVQATFNRCARNLRHFYLACISLLVFPGKGEPDADTIRFLKDFPDRKDTRQRFHPTLDEVLPPAAVQLHLVRQLLPLAHLRSVQSVMQLDEFIQDRIQCLQEPESSAFGEECSASIQVFLFRMSGLSSAGDEGEVVVAGARLLDDLLHSEATKLAGLHPLQPPAHPRTAAALKTAVLALLPSAAKSRSSTQGACNWSQTLRSAMSRFPRPALEFVVRAGVEVLGPDGFLQLCNEDLGWAWVPQRLGLAAVGSYTDSLLVYGTQLRADRDQLLSGEGSVSGRAIDHSSSLPKKLALVSAAHCETALDERWTSWLPSHKEPALCQLLRHCFVVFTAAETAEASLLGVFRSVFAVPSALATACLPAMPDDPIDWGAVARGKIRFYVCPKGHPYQVGECLLPMEGSVCREPGCGEIIGGTNHRPAAGNRKLLEDEARRRLRLTGHCVPLPQSPAEALTRERSLSPVENTCLRLLLHTSMLTAALKSPDAVMQMMTRSRPDSNEQVVSVLKQHVDLELQALGMTLQKTQDEVLGLMHLLLQKASQLGKLEGKAPEAWLTSGKERKKYEDLAGRLWLRPVLGGLGQELERLRRLQTEDRRESCWPLAIAFPLPGQGHKDPLWTFRPPPTVSNICLQLTSQIQVLTLPEQDGLLPLRTFCRHHAVARVVAFLPSLHRLHSFFRQHFRRGVSLSEVSRPSTIEDFIERQVAEADADWLQGLVKDFFAALRLALDIEELATERVIVPRQAAVEVQDIGAFASAPKGPTFMRLRLEAGEQIDFGQPCANLLEVLLPLPFRRRLCRLSYCLTSVLRHHHNKLVSEFGNDLPAIQLSEAVAQKACFQLQDYHKVSTNLVLFTSLATSAAPKEEASSKPGVDLLTVQKVMGAAHWPNLRLLREESEWLEPPEERLTRSQERLRTQAQRPIGEPRSDARKHLCQELCDDLATTRQCLESLELLIQLSGHESQPAPLTERAEALFVAFPPPLEKLTTAQIPDAWTTLLVHQALLERQQGSDELPAPLPEALLHDGGDFGGRDGEEEGSSLGLLRAAMADAEAGTALLRLLSVFVRLYAQRAAVQPSQPPWRLRQFLDSSLQMWIYEEAKGWLTKDDEEEMMEALVSLPNEVPVRHLGPAWRFAADRCLAKPVALVNPFRLRALSG